MSSEEQPPTQPQSIQQDQPNADLPLASAAAEAASDAAPAPAACAAAASDAAPAPAACAAAAAATAAPTSESATSVHTLHSHLYRAKALSERLLAVMAQREERLAEIKRRVSALEQGGGENIQPLVEAEANMRDAHTRMKSVLNDLGKELEVAGVTAIPAESLQLSDLPSHTGQGDEVAFLYKHLLLALGEWKAAQQRLAADRAESLAKQVQNLRDQVAREHQETQRIRRRKEELERLRVEKQEELEAIKREPDGGPGDANGHTG